MVLVQASLDCVLNMFNGPACEARVRLQHRILWTPVPQWGIPDPLQPPLPAKNLAPAFFRAHPQSLGPLQAARAARSTFVPR